MLDSLAATGPVVWASVLAKTLLYLASLIAAGAVFFLLVFGNTRGIRQAGQRLALGTALVAAFSSILLLGLRTSFLGGGTLAAALDVALLQLVLEGPLGTSSTVRLIGLGLIMALAVNRPANRWLAFSGALLVAASFAFAGHSLKEPRSALAALFVLHTLAAAFWIGALAPLHRIAGTMAPTQAGAIMLRFGHIALWVVGALVLAGLTLATLLLGGLRPLFTTDYGQLLVAKIALVGGLGTLAAYNKLSLSPALAAGSSAAARKLRFIVRLEILAAAMILLVTATITTLTSPA